jgi:hypothetical protein
MDSNIGWNRVDMNMDRSLEYEVALSLSDRPVARVTLRYLNRGEPKPEGCGNQWRPTELNTYLQAARGCYWDLQRTYVAHGASVVASDAAPLPPLSVAEQTGYGQTGENTFQADFDENGAYISSLLAIEAGARKALSWVQTLPESVIARNGSEATYSLLFQAQPGVSGRRVSVDIWLPDGYAFKSSSVPPVSVEGQLVRFQFDLRADTELAVKFAPPTAG